MLSSDLELIESVGRLDVSPSLGRSWVIGLQLTSHWARTKVVKSGGGRGRLSQHER